MNIVSLLPNTGVQYIELPALFTEKELKAAKNKWTFNIRPSVDRRMRLVERKAQTTSEALTKTKLVEEESGSAFDQMRPAPAPAKSMTPRSPKPPPFCPIRKSPPNWPKPAAAGFRFPTTPARRFGR